LKGDKEWEIEQKELGESNIQKGGVGEEKTAAGKFIILRTLTKKVYRNQ